MENDQAEHGDEAWNMRSLKAVDEAGELITKRIIARKTPL